MGLFGQNMKKLKILKLSRDSRYLQKLALKIETLKKHEKSQAHVSCTETLKARKKPQESPLAKSLNKGST